MRWVFYCLQIKYFLIEIYLWTVYNNSLHTSYLGY